MGRKRVNISIAPGIYEQLEALQKRYRFRNVCEIVAAMVNVMIDHIAETGKKKPDVPEDDGQFIKDMFRELENFEQTPANTVPPRQHRQRRAKAAELNTDNRNIYYDPERDGPPVNH